LERQAIGRAKDIFDLTKTLQRRAKVSTEQNFDPIQGDDYYGGASPNRHFEKKY
jgi:hypothetical protein